MKIKCNFCGKKKVKKFMKKIRIIESPKDEFGIIVYICKKCQLDIKED